MDGGDESDGEQPEEERREAPPHDGVNKPIRHGGGGGGRAATLTGIHGWINSRADHHHTPFTSPCTPPHHHHTTMDGRAAEKKKIKEVEQEEEKREREKRIRPSDPLFRDFPPYAIATEWMDGWMDGEENNVPPPVDRSIDPPIRGVDEGRTGEKRKRRRRRERLLLESLYSPLGRASKKDRVRRVS